MSGASSSEWSEPGEAGAGEATTDCESVESEDGAEQGLEGAAPARARRRRRVLCAYEWVKSCSYCFDARLTVVALRVEVLPAASGATPQRRQAPVTQRKRQRQRVQEAQPQLQPSQQPHRRALCHVLGDSPLKALAKSRGVALGEVAGPGGALWLSRACPACCAPQGEFELSQMLETQDDEWLERHRVLELGLPRRLDPSTTEKPIINCF
jgi:hypothetical protein